MKTIVLCGGGTAGHIMPHIALLPELKKHFDKIYYIGTNGMEKDIVKRANIEFYEIDTPKFNRKLSFKTLGIPFRLLKSISKTKKILKQLNPSVIFSKGGYVSIPVAIAGKKIKIPVVSHESDLSMGLANKVIYHYCNIMCTAFEKTAESKSKCVFTGIPIREELKFGDKNKVLNQFEHDKNLPTVLVIGGSLGAKAINEVIAKNLDKLTKRYNVIHIVGKSGEEKKTKNYLAVKFVDNIGDFFAAADMCVSRSGANAIFELMTILKPMLLIPLPKGASRGDQVENAKLLESKKLAHVLLQENLNGDTLITEIDNVLKHKDELIKNLGKQDTLNATEKIVDILIKLAKK